MEITVYEDADAFAAAAAAWDELVLASPRPCPFQLSGWLLARWREGDARLRVALAATSDGPVAGLPLAIRRGVLRYGVLPTPGEDVILRAEGVPPGAVDDLLAAGGRGLAYFEHSGMRAESPLRSLGYPFRRPAPTDELFAVSLPAGWTATYETQFSPKARSNHARCLRRLGEVGEVELDLVREPERVEAALHHCFRLHRLRWSGRGGDSSSFASEHGRAWNLAAARALAAAGVVRLALLRLDGIPIAFAYNLLLGPTLWGHRQSFDPRFAKHSPGLLAVMGSIELAAAEGATRVELMTGEHGYKRQLATDVTPLSWAVLAPRGAFGPAAAAQRYGRFLLLRRLRGGRILTHARRARALFVHAAP